MSGYEIVLRGGPADGQRYTIQRPPPLEFYVPKASPSMETFNPAVMMKPVPTIERIVYQRVGRTNEYACINKFDPAQEVINFCRQIGLEITHWQETALRDWFYEADESRDCNE